MFWSKWFFSDEKIVPPQFLSLLAWKYNPSLNLQPYEGNKRYTWLYISSPSSNIYLSTPLFLDYNKHTLTYFQTHIQIHIHILGFFVLKLLSISTFAVRDCNAMTHVSTPEHAWKKTNLSINRTKFVVNSKYSYCLSSHIDGRTHMAKFAAVRLSAPSISRYYK